ncbi:hypothetical protein Tco_0424818 [Tanacetum coccineum]
MHNNIMAAGSRDRPPMLATGRYAQWRSRFLRYIDTRPNGDALRKCILKGPYTPTIVTTPAVPATENSPAVPEQTTVETVMNMTPENRAHFELEKEAIHLILTGIGDEIYSTADACKTAQEMWEAIERLQQELEHKVAKLLKENETLKRHYKEMFDSIKTTRAKNIEHTTYLIANNDKFKAQLQEKGFAITALKNELRKLTGNSVNTKFAKSSILGKPALQPRRNQSVVRQPTAFKSERPRFSKQRFASQVDVNNDLSKPVTTHYLPKERESAVAKPHHMIAPGSSRYSSNDMVHNHYLEEAKKKTQESSRNSEPSVMPSARSQSTANGSKPKPRINNQKSRNWPASKSSCVTTKTVPIAEHSRNSRSFSDSKHFSTYVQRFHPIRQQRDTTKVDSEPTNGSNDDITNQYECEQTLDVSAGLQGILMVDSEPTNGSNDDITNQYECKQTLDVSAAMTSDHNSSELGIHDHSNELSSSKLVPKVVPPADKTATSRQELELLFHHHITMLRSYALSWKPCQGDSLNLPDHRYNIYTVKWSYETGGYIKMEMVMPHSSWSRIHYHMLMLKLQRHSISIKFQNHESSRIKDKDFRANSDINDNSLEIKLRGRLLKSFQDDAKYEHVGQGTRLQGGKDDQDKQGKDLRSWT